MDDEKQQITPLQARLLAALLTSPSVDAACAGVKIHRSTFYRWLRDDPVFKREHDRRAMEVTQATFHGMLFLATHAVTVLGLSLQSSNEQVRLRAAELILSNQERWLERNELLKRIEELEEETEDD